MSVGIIAAIEKKRELSGSGLNPQNVGSKSSVFVEKCRKFAEDPDVWIHLKGIWQGGRYGGRYGPMVKPSDSLEALKLILAYGLGKPTENIQIMKDEFQDVSDSVLIGNLIELVGKDRIKEIVQTAIVGQAKEIETKTEKVA